MSEAMVVFFLPLKHVRGLGPASPNAELPKAWGRANGPEHRVLEELSCHSDTVDLQLVVFDDAENIPERWVDPIRKLEAVTLIWHGGSGKHKKIDFDTFLNNGTNCDASARRTTKNAFEFHHETGDDTFVKIKGLLEGSFGPQAFIDCFSRAVVLRQILDAACLVQLQRIAPETQPWEETVQLVSQCLEQTKGSGRAKRWTEQTSSFATKAEDVEKALDWLKSEYVDLDSVEERASRT